MPQHIEELTAKELTSKVLDLETQVTQALEIARQHHEEHGDEGYDPVLLRQHQIINTTAVHVFDSGATAITTGTRTNLTFDSERYDGDAMHSTTSNPGRLTCTVAGKYHITANVTFQTLNGGSATFAFAAIQLNGGNDIGFDDNFIDNAAVGTALTVSVTYDLAVEDYVEVDVQHDFGANRNVLSTADFTPEFMMERIG